VATVFASSSEEAFKYVAAPNDNPLMIKINFVYPDTTWMKSRIDEANEVMIYSAVRFCHYA